MMIRKLSFILSIVLVAAFALTSCAAPAATEAPAAEAPAATEAVVRTCHY